jgi:ribosomal protein S6
MGLGAYEGFHLTNSHMGIPNLAFEVQKVIFGYFISISVACPILKAKELV